MNKKTSSYAAKIFGSNKSWLITHKSESISDTCYGPFLPLLLYAGTSPVWWKHHSSSLSYLCSHIRDLTIPDCFISLCNNKSTLHPLDYLIFPLRFSEQILHQKCISPQGTVLMAVLTGPNTSISSLNYAFLFIISKTGILSTVTTLRSPLPVCILSLQLKE